jgi:hypothetical protein
MSSDAEMIDYAQQAVTLAHERFNIHLDYTEKSLVQAEKILDKLHHTLPQRRTARPGKYWQGYDVWQMAKLWGAYYGEVIRQQWGGVWVADGPDGVEKVLRSLGVDIRPIMKVWQRLTNGQSDNVWQYYQVLRRQLDTNEGMFQ